MAALDIPRAVAELTAAGVDNPALDARLLIAHALGCDRAALLMQNRRELSEEENAVIQTLIARRTRREPVSRILGLREFWGLPFGLNEATLDPRPDSETLIETALKLHSATQDLRILDLGTGTGCLLLALLHELPLATGLGIDSAPRAVEQAQANAARLGLAERTAFKINNWVDDITETFDLIISNPPYIASGELPTLMPEVRDYDPSLALDGGSDGLEIYRHLLPQLPNLLKPKGSVVFEVGRGQAAAVVELFHRANMVNVRVFCDLNEIERCVTAQKVG